MNIFEGIDRPGGLRGKQSPVLPLGPLSCSASQLLVAAAGGDSYSIASLSAAHAPQRSEPCTYSLQADVQSLCQAGLPCRAQLLCACEQQGDAFSWPPLDADGSCLLALYKLGSSLQLYAVRPTPDAGGSNVQLLAELQHEGFSHLQPRDCHLLPGPLLLLQPEQWQLLVLLPAGQQPGACRAAARGAATACESAQPAWELLQVHLPAEDLLHAAAADPSVAAQLTTLGRSRDLNTGLSRLAGTQQDIAAAPWRLLQSSVLQHSSALELLVALPVANAGAQPPLPQQQQAEQQGVLLCMLQLSITSAGAGASTSPAAAEQEDASVTVQLCQLLDLQAPASAALVFVPYSKSSMPSPAATPAVGSTRLVAVASEAGDLHVLQLRSHCCSSSMSAGLQLRPGRQRQQLHQQLACFTGSKPLATHQLQGAVREVVHLPRAFIGNTSRRDVLAVLHQQHGGSGTPSSSMAVTLLQLQGGQLRQLALVPDALGLCAPAHAPAGMLCPVLAASKPQQLQQQRRTDATNTGVLQLAAGILLSSNSHRTGQQDSQAASSLAPDLRCYAVLETAEKAASLPGPLLCVLAQAPAASGQQGMQAAAGAAARLTEAAAAAGGGDGGSEAAPGTGQASSELQGLHMMLAALEHRWQHDTRDLCVLQHQMAVAQRLAATGHMQLCQLAADTLYRSTVRQYVLPVNSILPDAALAVFQAGRRLAEEQQLQRQGQGQRQQAGGTMATAVLPHLAASDAPTSQLLLEAVSVRSKLTDRQLQLAVCVKPVLQAVNPQAPQAWSGALLQPHHAELLVWHVHAAGITAASSWAWDPLTGQLTATATVSVSTLLQAHSSSNTSSARSAGHAVGASGAAASSSAAGIEGCPAESWAELAQVLAAAAGVAAPPSLGGAHDSSCSSSKGQDSGSIVSLHAAVVVSASCSSQAVVQWESQQSQHPAAAQALLQRSQLLSPALALLHLPPVQIPTPDLLLHQLLGAAGTHKGNTSTGLAQAAAAQRQHEGASRDRVAAAVADDAAKTPAKPSSMGPTQANGSPLSSTGCASGLPGVVPPTPCSAGASAGDLGVIPDSQDGEDAEHHVTQEKLQEWWQTQLQRQEQQQQRQGNQSHLSAAADGSGAMDWEAVLPGGKTGAEHAPAAARMPSSGAAAERAGRSGYSARQLLLKADAADLTLLPVLLQREQCFEVVQPATDVLLSAHQQEDGGTDTLCRLVLQLSSSLSAHAAVGQQQHPAALLELLYISTREVHVTLLSPPVPAASLDALEQLLLLTVRRLPGGHTIAVTPSFLDAARLARLATAAGSLTAAAHKHVKVLELVLQSLPDSMTRGAGVQLRTAAPHAVAAELAQHPQAATHTSQNVAQLVVSGKRVGRELSECWLSCMQSQAEVDLAVCQLSARLSTAQCP